jgi:hypothetical protein
MDLKSLRDPKKNGRGQLGPGVFADVDRTAISGIAL